MTDNPNPSDPPAGAITYGLTMPAVVTKGNGGDLDGLAFICGWQVGALEAELRTCHQLGATPRGHYVYPEIAPQLDLIAMENQFTLTLGDGVPDWRYVTFVPVDPHAVIADE